MNKSEGVKYDELVEIQLQNGELRHGQVLEVNEDKAMVQILRGPSGINIRDTKVRFRGKTIIIKRIRRHDWSYFRWNGERHG